MKLNLNFMGMLGLCLSTLLPLQNAFAQFGNSSNPASGTGVRGGWDNHPTMRGPNYPSSSYGQDIPHQGWNNHVGPKPFNPPTSVPNSNPFPTPPHRTQQNPLPYPKNDFQNQYMTPPRSVTNPLSHTIRQPQPRITDPYP